MKSIYLGKFRTLGELNEYRSTQGEDPGIINGDAYSSLKWLEKQIHFFEMSANGIAPRHSNLPLLGAITCFESVLDIGGGSGWVKNFLPFGTIYNCYELSNAKRYFQDNLKSKIAFLDDVECIKSLQPKVLYSNSTIQYFMEQTIFDRFFSLADADWILLDDLYLSTSDPFYSLQRYFDQFIPTYFNSKEVLLERIRKFGYELVLDFPYPAQYSAGVKMQIEVNSGRFEEVEKPRTLLFKKQISQRVLEK